MIRDEWGVVINTPENYKEIAKEIQDGGQCVFAWTDQEGTQYDLLISHNPIHIGGLMQRGIRPSDMFVGVMSRGCFGFEINDIWKSPGYISEKLRIGNDITCEKLSELINGIIQELI